MWQEERDKGCQWDGNTIEMSKYLNSQKIYFAGELCGSKNG